jgi:O-antigen/teichoic acid export membrane protein
LQISAAVLVLRFAETVFTSALRGYERYRPMVVLAVVARTAVIGSSVALALNGSGLVAIMWATLAIGCASLAGQAWLAFRVIDFSGLWTRVEIGGAVREVFSFSAFSWLKSTLGVLVGYADRLLVGALLGTEPLAFYALCGQLTQTVPALIASAFNFVFPNFCAHGAAGRWSQTQRSYRIAATTAALLALGICVTLILFARPILRIWLGASAERYQHLLIAMAIGNGLLAISVVPHYAALAMGRARSLVVITLVAGIASLTSGYFLIGRIGLLGAGIAKIVAGAVLLFSFKIARRGFREHQRERHAVETASGPANKLTFAQ